MASAQPSTPARSAYVMVKAVEGRLAFTKARRGVRIPDNKFISVENTRWIRRLANHHGDIIIQGVEQNNPSPTPAS